MTTRILPALVLAASIPMSRGAEAQFYGDPPDATHPWGVHDPNRPQPTRVEPAAVPGAPPSDAVVLFDGTEKSLANWEYVKKDRQSDWEIKDGALQCKPRSGYIKTKEKFGDCQLHVEWASPVPPEGSGQGRGNSGIFLMGMAEVQVLDNYQNPTYSDGFAGSVYGVMPPMANALRPSGEWQSYDIIFRRPIVKDGNVIDQGAMTVFCNGVLLQDSTPLEGGGGHKKRSQPKAFPDAESLQLQDHGNPVRYRNIWYRAIRPRPTDGGTDGQLSPDATKAKRAEIAAEILKNAETKTGTEQLLGLMESLIYQDDADVMKRIAQTGDKFASDLRALDKKPLEDRKAEVLKVSAALTYLADNKRVAADMPLRVAIEEIINANGWNPKKK